MRCYLLKKTDKLSLGYNKYHKGHWCKFLEICCSEEYKSAIQPKHPDDKIHNHL
ncbi:hypothetical protein TRIP_B350164 [uncultured Desulfatiglans sp.]|uniref:Uncharacterized protein n=1 Tax=Uncultured Desulfatiglans sp. TaxID=1748965 RepID=A0A653AAC9_UNCDX|nr:hypothetical protein TRIP_B350164 [uncultured Desulfatiglans sp.]